MDHVKAGEVVCQRVRLVKFKREMSLSCDVYANNFKACAVISCRRTPRATKKVK